MINAKEANVIYDRSGQEVKDYLKYKIEPCVVEAAKAGKKQVFVFVNAIECHHFINISPLTKKVMEKLKELGYTVRYDKDLSHKYIPKGLMDDDGSGPEYVNHGYFIGW